MPKRYEVFLDGEKIGYTQFENSDPPMGVVNGNLCAVGIPSLYEFLKSYCKKSNIKLNIDDPDQKCIETQSIEALKIINEDGVEIKGVGATIGGIDDDFYEVGVFGIPYPFYEQEFPHHCQAYYQGFSDKTTSA